MLGRAAARSVLAENPADEEDAKEKLSKYLYNRLVALRDSIWADDGWGYLAFNGAEGAMLRMLWIPRATGAEDASLARLSPLRSRHFNVLGRYHFTVTDSVLKGEMRPLRNPTGFHEADDFLDDDT